MGEKHRHFSREFKRDAVQYLLHLWRRRFLAQGCIFRPNPATDSDPKRPLIPIQTGHRFRFIPAGHSDPFRPPLNG
jgi:hypothetical protein